MKRFILALALATLSALAEAAPLTLSWQGSLGATKYTLYDSVDGGTTWRKVADTQGTSLNLEAPETGLVLYQVTATNALGETSSRDRGAWYNFQWSNKPSKLHVE